MSKRTIRVYQDLMGENEKWAKKTRHFLSEHNLTMLNFIGSPGCGKTTLLETMVDTLKDTLRFAVLEGDIATTKDAQRLDEKNVMVCQLLTNGSCHLEAKLVHTALTDFTLGTIDFIVIENVGNLVCPAEFDVGEQAKIAVMSVTEGEEKPLKYPLLFHEAKAVVLTKMDLLPHVPFSLETCLTNIKKINSNIPVFQMSALKNSGINDWLQWLNNQVRGE